MYEVLSLLALVVLGQGEGAHDPAVPVDHLLRHLDVLVQHALDGRPRAVDVVVARHQDAPHEQQGHRELHGGPSAVKTYRHVKVSFTL